MSRRTDVLRLLLQSDEFVEEKGNEQQFLLANAKLIMTDLIGIATNAIQSRGVGILVVNLVNDSTTFMSGSDIEGDIIATREEGDTEAEQWLTSTLETIDATDWSKYVLITMISDDITKTYPISKEF